MMHNKSNFHYLSLLQALFCNYSHTTTHTKPSIQVHAKGSPQINTSFPIVVHEVFLHSFHNWRPESDTFNSMYCLSSQQSSLWDFNSWRLLSAWFSSNKNVSKCSLNPFIFSILGFYRTGFHNSVYASQRHERILVDFGGITSLDTCADQGYFINMPTHYQAYGFSFPMTLLTLLKDRRCKC